MLSWSSLALVISVPIVSSLTTKSKTGTSAFVSVAVFLIGFPPFYRFWLEKF